MKKFKIVTILLTGLMAFSASGEVFFCSYEFNPGSPNSSWSTSYPDGDTTSFAKALAACELDGGTGIRSSLSMQ